MKNNHLCLTSGLSWQHTYNRIDEFSDINGEFIIFVFILHNTSQCVRAKTFKNIAIKKNMHNKHT